jgi:hypothetical protein
VPVCRWPTNQVLSGRGYKGCVPAHRCMIHLCVPLWVRANAIVIAASSELMELVMLLKTFVLQEFRTRSPTSRSSAADGRCTHRTRCGQGQSSSHRRRSLFLFIRRETDVRLKPFVLPVCWSSGPTRM